jgi:flagellar basal body-associated protein FliL
MSTSQTSNAKTILVLVAVAIVVAVVVTVIQTLILGKSNVAITGGVVGATVVGLGLSTRRKKSS